MTFYQYMLSQGFTWIELVRFVFTSLCVVFLFRDISCGQPRRSLRILGYLILCAPLPLYLAPEAFQSVVGRFLIHFLNVAGYLYFAKKVNWKRSLYFAGIWQILNTIMVDIHMTPLFTLLRHGDAPTASLNVNLALGLLVEYAILFTVCGVFLHFVDLSSIRHIEKLQVGVISLLNVILQYEKYSLKQLYDLGGTHVPQLTVYPIFISLVLLFSTIFFHRYLNEREQRERYHIQSVITDLQLRNAQAIASTEHDVHRLYHDMKNHLVAIKSLSKENGKVSDYVDGLMKGLAQLDQQVETGNPVLNGLLSEKLHIAQTIPATLNIFVDFTVGSFLDPIDVCVIFGNALDNALEAVQTVPEEERIISVRSGSFANTLILDFSNPYSRAIDFDENGLPRSSKGDSAWHGIGVSSIQESVEKYGGTIAIDASQGNLFHLKIMIPLPERDDPED